MIVANGQTDVTSYFVLRDSVTKALKTGVDVTTIDVYYVEEGAAISAKADLTALAAADSAHADNKGYEIGQGLYRIDWPDAAFDGGVGKKVELVVVCSGVDTVFEEVTLSPAVNAVAISGSATAADNVEAAMLQGGDAAGVDLSVRSLAIGTDAPSRRVHIVGSESDEGAIRVQRLQDGDTYTLDILKNGAGFTSTNGASLLSAADLAAVVAAVLSGAETTPIAADLAKILDTALTETSAGYLAAAFKKLLDVETPAVTMNDLARTGADGDTLETLSDQLDGPVSANVSQIMGSTLAAKVLAAANYAYQDDGVIVLDLSACDTDAERGTALDAAITAVQALTPGGNAISSTNRACLLIPPGHYNVAALEPTISVSGVDLVALKPQMGGRRQYTDTNDITCFRPPGTLIYTSDVDSHALVQGAADIQLRGFGIAQLDESGVVEKLYRSALYVAVDANDESVYDQMYFWSTLFEQSTYSPVGFQKHVGGTWTQCIANSNAWRVYTDGASAIFRARMEDCEGGSGAFIGDNTDFSCSASGCHLVRCRAIGGLADHSGYYAFGGCTSWGTAIDSTCYFEECEAGNNAFALGQTCAGTFIRCRAGMNSFGSDSGGKDGVFSGHAVECIAGRGSFGGGTAADQGTMSGVLERCTILSNNQPLRLSGGVIKDCLIQTTTTDRDCIKLLDSTSKITGTTLIALGTGKAINADSALSFYGARNHYVGGLGTNVTNIGTADEVTPTTAAVATIQSGLATTIKATQAMLRSMLGVTGNVYIVKYNASEDLTGDGLTFDTPKLTAGPGIKTVVEAMSAGDACLIGPGTFALGNNRIRFVADTMVIAGQRDATKITSTLVSSPAIVPATRSRLENVTIEAINSGECLGAYVSSGDSAFTDAVIKNVRLIASGDCVYLAHTSPLTLTLHDCILDSLYDGIAVFGAGAHRVTAIRPVIKCEASAYVARCVVIGEDSPDSKVHLYEPNLYAVASGTAQYARGAEATSGEINLYGGSIYAAGTATSYALAQQSGDGVEGTIRIFGTQYDRTKVSGTIIEHATDNQVTPTAASKTGYALSESGVTAVQSGLSTHSAADVKTAMEADGSKLDHLWETTEDNAGTRRFTTAGLANAPKTGFKLASDGLDSVATTAPTGVASNFREMVVQTWRRWFKGADLNKDTGALKTYADDGTTPITTQTCSDDGTTQAQGPAT